MQGAQVWGRRPFEARLRRAPQGDGDRLRRVSVDLVVVCWIACQTRYGVHGVSMWWMPSTDSASTMALTPADSEPTVPASPAPLTPSGLVGVGTGLSSIVTLQKSSARGMA